MIVGSNVNVHNPQEKTTGTLKGIVFEAAKEFSNLRLPVRFEFKKSPQNNKSFTIQNRSMDQRQKKKFVINLSTYSIFMLNL